MAPPHVFVTHRFLRMNWTHDCRILLPLPMDSRRRFRLATQTPFSLPFSNATARCESTPDELCLGCSGRPLHCQILWLTRLDSVLWHYCPVLMMHVDHLEKPTGKSCPFTWCMDSVFPLLSAVPALSYRRTPGSFLYVSH